MLGFLQKPMVQMALFGTAVAGAGAFFYLQDSTRAGADATPPKGMGQAAPENVNVARQDVKTSQVAGNTKVERLVLPSAKPEPPSVVSTPPPAEQKPPAPVFPNLVQLSNAPVVPAFEAKPPKVFAPRGTLIKAALVITLESNAIGTPVLGMVTEDVYFQGNLIVPAGTQVQAEAFAGSNVRDRIDVRGAFRFLWTDGSEYICNGIALDHEQLPDGTFAITDGSPGIRGIIKKTDEYAELKILVAEAMKGIMVNNQSQFQSVYGLVPENTNRNAALGGGAASAGAYSNLLSKKMEKDMEFVQVAAGTSFYIYTTEIFEPELRSIAGIRQGNQPKTSMDFQKEAHEALTAKVTATNEEVKSQLEKARNAEVAAAKQKQQDALTERTRALLAPTPPRTTPRPQPTGTPVPVSTKP